MIQRNFRGQFHLETADGPHAATAKSEAGEYAIVVADMRMPRMSDAELLEVVKKQWPHPAPRASLPIDGDLAGLETGNNCAHTEQNGP